MSSHLATLLELNFDSKNLLVQAIKDNCIENGFAASIVRSDNKRRRITIACDMSGVYRNVLGLTGFYLKVSMTRRHLKSVTRMHKEQPV